MLENGKLIMDTDPDHTPSKQFVSRPCTIYRSNFIKTMPILHGGKIEENE